VELGPQDARTQAVKSLLQGQPHVALAIDCKGQHPWKQLLELAAVLLSHRTPHVSVDKLYHPSLFMAEPTRHRLQRQVQINGRFNTSRFSACPTRLARSWPRATAWPTSSSSLTALRPARAAPRRVPCSRRRSTTRTTSTAPSTSTYADGVLVDNYPARGLWRRLRPGAPQLVPRARRLARQRRRQLPSASTRQLAAPITPQQVALARRLRRRQLLS
jgi:hypothetical protein